MCYLVLVLYPFHFSLQHGYSDVYFLCVCFCDCRDRNQEIFGEDANIFNPERWTRDIGTKQGLNVGVYGNL